MSTNTEQLSADLLTAEQRVAALQEQLGVAALDGKATKKLQNELADARADVERLTAALKAAGARDAAEAEGEATEASRREHVAIYTSIRDFAPVAADLVRARAELKRAEQAFKDCSERNPLHRRALRLINNRHERVTTIDAEGKKFTHKRPLEEIADLDVELLIACPNPTGGLPNNTTVENCEQVHARAAELVEAEEKGEADPVTGPKLAARRAEVRAAREAEREAREAKERAEQAKRPKPKPQGKGRPSDIPIFQLQQEGRI